MQHFLLLQNYYVRNHQRNLMFLSRTYCCISEQMLFQLSAKIVNELISFERIFILSSSHRWNTVFLCKLISLKLVLY